MASERIRGAAVAWTILLAGMVVACIRIGGTQERRLVDLNDGPLAVRLQVAQEYVTAAQLSRLRSAARAHFPHLTDRDLGSLELAWQTMKLADSQHVMVVVTFMPDSKAVDAKAVADYVAQLVLADVGPKLRAGGTTRT
jgi:hypothetical protein